MSNLKQLKNNLEDATSLKLVTESLSEVAALRFRATRDQILHNKVFYTEVNKVYATLKQVANHRKLLAARALPKNQRAISVLITSNYQFYGGLDYELTTYFSKMVQTYQTDKLVIGSTGKDYFSTLYPDRDFETVILQSDLPTSQEIDWLVKKVQPYQKILIFHAKFSSILHQAVDIADLSEPQAEKQMLVSDIDFIVEPELNKMLQFFETQVLGASLKSYFLQSNLSHTAARMIRMDQADEKAEKEISRQTQDVTRLRKKLQNLHILETFPSLRKLKGART